LISCAVPMLLRRSKVAEGTTGKRVQLLRDTIFSVLIDKNFAAPARLDRGRTQIASSLRDWVVLVISRSSWT
jgi:hypothetical protein